MKIKNIGIIEAHIEKIILGISVLALFATFYFYILSSPNAVTIDDTKLAPGEIDEVLLDQAKNLQSVLNNPTPAKELREIKVPAYLDNFKSRTAKTYVPDQLAYSFDNRPAQIGTDDEDTGNAPTYYVPKVPAPVIAATRADQNTILAKEVAKIDELGEALSSGPPYDVQMISIAGNFPMADMVAELQNAPGDPNIKAIPEDWWKDNFSIVEIEVQRQILNEDGTWGAPERVAPFPGSTNFVDRPISVPDAVEGREIIRDVRDNRLQILQPSVPGMKIPWEPPAGKAEVVDPRIQKLVDLNRDLQNLDRQLNVQERALERPGVNDRQKAGIKTRIKVLEDNIKALKADRDTIEKALNDEGKDIAKNVPGADLINQETVSWWRLDIKVMAGRTYRFRSRVHVFNPLYVLFRNQDKIDPKQNTDLGTQLTLEGQWSEWAEPVNTKPSQYFYAISGGKNPAPGRINFEVFKFFNGALRKEVFKAGPGDVVGGKVQIQDDEGIDRTVVFDTGLTVIDLEDFEIQGGLVPVKTLRVVLMDNEGNITEKIIADDRKDIKRSELQGQLASGNGK